MVLLGLVSLTKAHQWLPLPSASLYGICRSVRRSLILLCVVTSSHVFCWGYWAQT